jgi:hypothetical protein
MMPEEKPERGQSRTRVLHANQGKRKRVLSRNPLVFLA